MGMSLSAMKKPPAFATSPFLRLNLSPIAMWKVPDTIVTFSAVGCVCRINL